MWDTVLSRLLVTHIPVRSAVTDCGALPTDTAAITCPDTGLMRDTSADSLSVTQTLPNPIAIAAGCAPTGIVAVTRSSPLVLGSITDTVSSSAFATQTRPKPTATACGAVPTSMSSTTVAACGLIRETERSPAFVTHTAPAPTAMPLGS